MAFHENLISEEFKWECFRFIKELTKNDRCVTLKKRPQFGYTTERSFTAPVINRNQNVTSILIQRDFYSMRTITCNKGSSSSD